MTYQQTASHTQKGLVQKVFLCIMNRTGSEMNMKIQKKQNQTNLILKNINRSIMYTSQEVIILLCLAVLKS